MPFSLLCPSRCRNYRSRGSFVSGNIVRRQRRRRPSAALRLERFTFPPCYCFLPSTRPAPSSTSLLLTDTLIAFPPAVLISHAATILTYNQWTARGGNSVRNKVGIAVGFLFVFFFAFFLCPLSRNHSPISPSRRSLIGCAAAKAIGEIRAFNGTVLFKEAKKACCLLFRASSSRLSEEGGGCGGEEKHSPRVQKKKRQICNSGAKKGSRGSQSKPGKTAGERAGAFACLLINKALSSRRKTAIISHPTASSLPVSLKVTCRH